MKPRQELRIRAFPLPTRKEGKKRLTQMEEHLLACLGWMIPHEAKCRDGGMAASLKKALTVLSMMVRLFP